MEGLSHRVLGECDLKCPTNEMYGKRAKGSDNFENMASSDSRVKSVPLAWPRVLKLAASKTAHFPAFDHSGPMR